MFQSSGLFSASFFLNKWEISTPQCGMISTGMAAKEGSCKRPRMTQGRRNFLPLVCICVLVVTSPPDSGVAFADQSPCSLTRNAAGTPTILELQCLCQRSPDNAVLATVRMFHNGTGSTAQRTIYSSDLPLHKESPTFMEVETQETTKENFARHGRMKLILRQGNVTTPAAYAGRYSCNVIVMTNGHVLPYSVYLDVFEPDLLPKTTATLTTTTPSTSLTTTTPSSTTQAMILPVEEQPGIGTDSSVSKTNLYIAVLSLCALLVCIVIFLAYVFTVRQRRMRNRLPAMQEEEKETVDKTTCWEATCIEDEQTTDEDSAHRPEALTRATPRQISGRWPPLMDTPRGRYHVLCRSSDAIERWNNQQLEDEVQEDLCIDNNCPGPHRSLSQHSLIRSSGRRLPHDRSGYRDDKAHLGRQRHTWVAGDGGTLYLPGAGVEDGQRVVSLYDPVEKAACLSADELYLAALSSSEQDSQELEGESKKGNRLSSSPHVRNGRLQLYRTKSAPLVASHKSRRRSPSSSNAPLRGNRPSSVARNPRSKATISYSREYPAKERAPLHTDSSAGRVVLRNQLHPLHSSEAAPVPTRQGRNGRTPNTGRNRSSSGSSNRNSRRMSSRSSYSEDEHGDPSHSRVPASAWLQSSQRICGRASSTGGGASSTGRVTGGSKGRGDESQRGYSRGERSEERQSQSSGQTSSSTASPTTFPFTVTTPGRRTSGGGWSDESGSERGQAGRGAEVKAEDSQRRASENLGASKQTAAASRLASDSDSDTPSGLKRQTAGHRSGHVPVHDYTKQRLAAAAGDPFLCPDLRHADENETHCKRLASMRSQPDLDDDRRRLPGPGAGVSDDAVDLQTRGGGAGQGRARGSSHRVVPAGKDCGPLRDDRRTAEEEQNGLGGDRRDHTGGSQVRHSPRGHHGQYPLPVDCAADVSVNGRSGSGSGGGASAALQGKGLQKKDSNASSSSSSSGHGRRERIRGGEKAGGGPQGPGALALLGVEVVSTPENSSQFLHIVDHHHTTTTPKARLE